METGYINIAEIEFICDSVPLTMVVMKTSYFDQQRVERGEKNLLKAQGCSPVVYYALGFNSRPLPEEATGIGASCTLTCLDGREVFVPVTKGEGCSLTPATLAVETPSKSVGSA